MNKVFLTNLLLIAVMAITAITALFASAPMVFSLCLLVIVFLTLPLLDRGRGRWHNPSGFYLLIVLLVVIQLALDIWLKDGAGSEVWSAIGQALTGLIYGFIGYLLVQRAICGQRAIMEKSPVAISILVLATGVFIGTLWELMEFSIDGLFGWGLQVDLNQTMFDLFGCAFGSAIFAVLTFTSIQYHWPRPLGDLLHSVVEKNQGTFRSEDDPVEVLRRLGEGEREDQEFKSSLRTNMQTGEVDKRMEHAVLKSLAAFMNSEGGTLYVGVDDTGRPLGIDVQHFDNRDKFFLHFTNLFKQTIGAEYLPLIEPRIVPFEEKDVLQVICHRSKRPIFLRMDNKEQFFVRAGASSIELSGAKMMEYIQERFR